MSIGIICYLQLFFAFSASDYPAYFYGKGNYTILLSQKATWLANP